MEYRKEIDGLRAVAVLPVILFHAGATGFSGGYVGVDVFFVISGYLITSLILEEKASNRFSIINFYERRARRILPALSLLLVFTTVCGYVFMPAYFLKEYSQSLFSVATFSSNFYFYLTSGYFSTAAEEKPLIHMWSLAIEEQYYLFFPAMIVLLWSLGRRFLLSVILLIATVSLALAQFLSSKHAVDANFYLITSRAWELFSGSVVAFLPLKRFQTAGWKRECLSFLGIILIIYSVIYFDRHTPFPSFYALVPVVGTCLIIVFADSTSALGRLLSAKIPVAIGLISYSLYLWHQSLFAFLRLKSVGEPPVYLYAVAIVITFLAAFASWRYVETPFRNKAKFTRQEIFQGALASTAIFLMVGLAGHVFEGFQSRFDTIDYSATMENSPKRKECHTRGQDYLGPDEACRYFGKHVTWAGFGDSHVVEPAYALAKKLEVYDEGLVHLTFSACPPALLFEIDLPGCSKWIEESLAYLENDQDVEHVLLGFRYSAFLHGDQLNVYPGLPDVNPGNQYTNFPSPLSSEEAREVYWESLETIVRRLLRAEKDVYILYPIPELPVDIRKAVAPFSILGTSTMFDLERTTTTRYYFERHGYILGKLDSLPYSEKLHAVRPLDVICEGDYCAATRGGIAVYFDDNHLSMAGSGLVIDSMGLDK